MTFFTVSWNKFCLKYFHEPALLQTAKQGAAVSLQRWQCHWGPLVLTGFTECFAPLVSWGCRSHSNSSKKNGEKKKQILCFKSLVLWQQWENYLMRAGLESFCHCIWCRLWNVAYKWKLVGVRAVWVFFYGILIKKKDTPTSDTWWRLQNAVLSFCSLPVTIKNSP